jgi:hypothetical protein
MTAHDLTLRQTVIADQRYENDYSVYFEGRVVGRIKMTVSKAENPAPWEWSINPPLPIPSWGNGAVATKEGAMVAFRSAWNRFYARLTPAGIAQWHAVDDAARKRSGKK